MSGLHFQHRKEPPLSVKCIDCTEKQRVSSFHQISKGCHIQHTGDNFRFNIGDKQLGLYTHHAIVKEVKIISKFEAQLNLIEFISTPYESNLKIRETWVIKSLKNDDIFIINYQHKTYSAYKIIRRAESIAEQCQKTDTGIEYSIMTCNCEHFCQWCCTGNEDSYQVHYAKGLLKTIFQDILNIIGKIVKVWWGFGPICRFFCCICDHRKLNKQESEGNFCKSYCRRLKRDLWLQLIKYIVTQSGILLMAIVIGATASNGVGLGVMGLITIISIGTMWLVQKLRKKIRSPFRGKTVKVKTMRNIWIGDVISFRYKQCMHDAIVTAAFPDKTNPKKGRISVVHYALPSVFGSRQIIEEGIFIPDLDKKVVLGHVYDPDVVSVHEPEVVVERARKRIGEKKFGPLSNRSSHFCHWAKVVQEEVFEDEEKTRHYFAYEYNREILPQDNLSELEPLTVEHRPGRKPASKTVGRSWAKIRDDIKPGQVIEFKYKWRYHKAVVTEVQYASDKPSEVSIKVVHYGEKTEVTEDTYTFDLNETDILIHKYLCVYTSQDIIRRARAMIGEKNYNAFTHHSIHLCKEIVEMRKDPLVLHFDDIQPGIAIIFNYRSSKHAAIVTKVNKDKSHCNTSGSVTIILYAKLHSFATWTILEEQIHVDLASDNIYKITFDGCQQYPPSKIIDRANNRIGEERFFFLGNPSWDFVQWAAVVQRPAIVDEVVYQRESRERKVVQKRLLLPKVKEASNMFQKVAVQSLDDLRLGDIVEYKYYSFDHQGIVSDIDTERNKVKVIHYGTSHIFAVRTIVEDILDINLSINSLKVYLTDPRECHNSIEIVKRAKKRLGEQDWKSGNRSMDMCIQCVFKKIKGGSK